MKTKLTLLLISFLFLGLYGFSQTPDINGIVYVKPTPSGIGNGTSWADATDNLKGAISASGVQKVFVAVGEYVVGPTSFVMKNNVEIYGGFDPSNGISTLSDTRILPTESIEGSTLNGQNTRPVVYNDYSTEISENRLNNSAILDGFTIKNGLGLTRGGGFYNAAASPLLRNLVIKDCIAYYGGAIYNVTESSPVISNVVFTNNISHYSGGAIANMSSSNPEISNSIIKSNQASTDGGGVYNNESDPTLVNVLIKDNIGNFGAGMMNEDASPTLINVAIIGNKNAINATSNPGAGMYNKSGYGYLHNVTIAGNSTKVNNDPTYVADAIYIFDGELTIYNSIIYNGGIHKVTPGTFSASYSLIEGESSTANHNLNASGITDMMVFNNPSSADYTLKKSSTSINGGNNVDYPYPGLDINTKDLAGNPRVYNFESAGVIDMGAYEYQGDPDVLPVKLINFNAKADGNHAKLQWQTANETNNKGFEIYRSSDDGQFVKIGDIPAFQVSNLKSLVSNLKSQIYSFTDYSPLNGNNYYKLVQIDNDGKTSELGTRTLCFSLSAFSLQLYPNPTENQLNISFEAGKFSQLEVMDLNGKVLQRLTINPTENSRVVSLGNYPTGIYIIKLSGAQRSESKRIIKN